MGLMRRVRGAMAEDGFGLPEVMVAMFIFALVSLGLLHTIMSVLTTTRDARSRQVALNLASQAIDDARSRPDLFNLLDSTWTTDVNGDTYTVSLETEWVSDPTVDLACGAGGGVLRYKRVNVSVTWPNMRPVTQPVRADTVINPDERLNDPSKGTILVSVIRGDGSGSAGVTVSAQPLSSGATPPSVITDSEGCAYMLQVAPGDYRVRVSRGGYVGVDQQTSASTDVTVTQGTSASASFQYDQAAGYTAHLASNAGATVPEVSSDMPVTFVSTYGWSTLTGTGRDRTHALHPFASGYTAFGGSCEAADPEAWPDRIDGADTYVGERAPSLGLLAGSSGVLDVPMALVQVTPGGGSSSSYLRIEAVADPAGEHPGCSTTVNYYLGNGSGTRTIALPYGSWRIYRGTSSLSGRTTLVTTVVPVTLGTFDGSTLTLDPREVLAP